MHLHTSTNSRQLAVVWSSHFGPTIFELSPTSSSVQQSKCFASNLPFGHRVHSIDPLFQDYAGMEAMTTYNSANPLLSTGLLKLPRAPENQEVTKLKNRATFFLLSCWWCLRPEISVVVDSTALLGRHQQIPGNANLNHCSHGNHPVPHQHQQSFNMIIVTHRIPRRLRGVRGEWGLEQVASVLVRLALPGSTIIDMMVVITILSRCGLELAVIGFDMMMVITILMRRKSGMDVDCCNLVENCENDRSNLKSKHEGDEKGVRRQQYPTLLTLIKLMIVC